MLKSGTDNSSALSGGGPGKSSGREGITPESRRKKELKNDLMALFRKHGYMKDDMNYEVRFKTTSGNIAWININSIEIIK